MRTVIPRLGQFLMLIVGVCVGCEQAQPLPAVQPPRSFAVPERPGRGDYAAGAFATPLSLEDAEQILMRTKMFAFGGQPPKRQVQAFNLLLDLPDAEARFTKIAAGAETAGKLYALCAFLAMGSVVPATLYSDVELGGTPVLVQDSDVVRGSMTSSEAAALIRKRQLWEQMRHAKEEGKEETRKP